MCRFIETIQLKDGVFKRLPFHQARLEKTMSEFFPNNEFISLEKYLKTIHYPSQGLFKCRVVYDTVIREMEITAYIRRQIQSLRIIQSDIQQLNYKSENRTDYEQVFAKRGNCDEIIVFKNGLLTDTSFSNIALYDGISWYTPKHPLIYGVNRAELINLGLLTEIDIKMTDLLNFKRIRLFNAMIEFGEIELDINKIVC